MHKSKRLNEVIYFHFGLNDASGNRKQGDPVTFVVRLAGAAGSGGIIYSASANLLSAATFGSAAYECVISACADVTTAFSASGEYAVFVLASVSGITPIGMIGSFQLSPPPVNAVQFDGASASAGVSALVHVALTNYDVPNSADISAIGAGVLTNADIATSADVSAIVSVVVANALNLANIATAGEVVSANAVSAAVINALTNYDVPTSADVSAIVEAVAMTSGSMSTLLSGILSAYNVASVGDITGGGVDYDQISAIVSARVQAAMVAYDVPTSNDVSVIVSGVLASYNVASADELAGGSGVTSAQVSSIVAQVLSDQNIATAGEVVSANAVSAAVINALTNYDVPTSADISAIVSAVVSGLFASYDIPTSADVSAIAAGVLANYDVPTSADVSAIAALALANYDTPTSADVSAIVQGALSNYDVPTSSDVSTMISAGVVTVFGASQLTALRNSLDAVLYGSAETGTLSTTQMKYTLNRAMGANDRLIGRLLTFRGGAIDGEQTQITDLDVATSIITYTTITQSPANGQAFTIS